jgi:hypothetical protein
LYDEIQEYKQIKVVEERRDMSRKIFNRFIAGNAERGVSMPTKIKEEIKKNFEVGEADLYLPLEDEIKSSNINDIYIRWAGSSDFQPTIDAFIKKSFGIR